MEEKLSIRAAVKSKIPLLKASVRRKKNVSPGSSPGMFVPTTDALKPKIKIYSYDKNILEEKELANVNEIKKQLSDQPERNHWIEIKGFGDGKMLEEISSAFSIHRLEMEDVVNTYQRPKLEEHDNHLFIISRMICNSQEGRMLNEQLSLFLGNNFVLTMQEHYEDLFDPVRKRLREGKGTIRQKGADYMAYALLDAIVDNYFPLLESIGDKLDELEDELFSKPNRESLQRIQLIKRELIVFRRTIFAERDKVNDLLRTSTEYISDASKIYLRDTYDHTIQVMDLVESYKEIVASLMDIYLSSVSNRLNQIMKVLAIISTIFIPLTFIVGVYGMNFSYTDPDTGEKLPLNMPELYSPYGYVGVWLVMSLIVVILLIIFKKRGWMERG